MGASQSNGRDARGGSQREKTADGIDLQDYYGLLELSPEATSDEIRKSYRKLALRFHPDKNPDDVEAANKRFALIGQAYEVLSDEQERAWYDNHREAILSGRGDGGDEDAAADAQFDEEDFKAFRSGKAQPAPAGSSSPGLTIRHLMRFLDPSLASDVRPPSADEGGFYGTYRRLFERLAEEERNAAPYPGENNGPVPLYEDFPSFGYSHTPYLFPKGEEAPIGQTQIRDFYAIWSGFSSRKGFGWKDGYKTNEAPDRRVKRLMEKENKGMRDAARREYNDMVRSIVAFIRKRDPRVKAHLAQVQASSNAAGGATGFGGNTPLTQAQKERMKKDVEMKRREQEAAAAAYQAQGWNTQQIVFSDEEDSEGESGSEGEEDEEDEGSAEGDDDGEEVGDDGEEEPDQWDCVACDKLFRSRAAWENHERSKKHRQEVWRLKKEMRKEEKAMGLARKDEEVDDAQGEDIAAGLEEEFSAGMRVSSTAAEGSGQNLSKKARQKLKKRQKAAGLALDEDGYLAETLEDRRGGAEAQSTADSSRITSTVASDGEEPVKATQQEDATGQTTPDETVVKQAQSPVADGATTPAKGRRARDKKKGPSGGAGEVCNVCKQSFPSRSKLFNHVRDSGHARAEVTTATSTNGKTASRDMDDWSEEDGPPKKGRKGKRR